MHTRKIIDPIAFAKSQTATVASANPSKVPAKVTKAAKAPATKAAPKLAGRKASEAKGAPKAVTAAIEAKPVKAPVTGKPLKAIVSEYGLTTKQARVILRKAWRTEETGILHSLRNRWIFDKTQEAKARAALKDRARDTDETDTESEEE